jgi:hypothetical protein
MRISELLSHTAFAESDQRGYFKTFAKTGVHNGAELTSSQTYRDDQIIKRKRAKNNYDVFVSPEFEVYGKKYRNVTNGHHSLSAALEDGVYQILSSSLQRKTTTSHY